MNAVVEYDTTVTKAQIAGIFRKANVVRYKKIRAGASVLRDIKTNYSYYSGVEIVENAVSFNVSASGFRPHYVKTKFGTFTISFTHGYTGQKFSTEEGTTILNQAITTLLANGFVIISENKFGITVGKVVA
jgi:hypothetical protein